MKAITTKHRNYRYYASDSDKNRAVTNHDDNLSVEQNHDAAAVKLCHKMQWDGPLMAGDIKPGERVYVFDKHANRVRFESNYREQRYTAHIEKLREEAQ
jgi:hypothetical protein